MKNYDFDGLKRVNKKTARNIFNNGGTIRICANKINPTNDFYNLFMDINQDFVLEKNFDKLINQYEYYNCNSECGYYTAFYVFD